MIGSSYKVGQRVNDDFMVSDLSSVFFSFLLFRIKYELLSAM